jgi:hypothetical protein
MQFKILNNLIIACALVFLAAFSVASSEAAEARKEKNLGTFGVWHAMADGEGSQTVCYMVTAKTTKPAGKSPGRKSYLMITHRPVEASSDVFSYGAGIPLDTKHGVTLRLGKKSFDLFTVKETAWARDPITDHKIAVVLRNSTSAQLSSIPAQGRATTLTDKFALTGALPAYRAINKACGLPDVVAIKPAAKKAVVKKKGVKKAVVKKKEVKKAVAKKPAAKATVVKKTTAKKAVAKKPKTKKSAAKIPDLKKTTTVKTTVKKTTKK